MTTGHHPRIGFKPQLQVLATGPREITIRAAFEDQVIEGPLLVELAPLLDGCRSRPEIIDDLGEAWNPLEIEYTIERLLELGLLHEEPFLEHSREKLLDWLGRLPIDPEEPLGTSTLEVETVGSIPRADLKERLRRTGVMISGRCDHRLLVSDGYLDIDLDCMIEGTEAEGLGWLVAVISPSLIGIGPAWAPGSSTCWACTRARIESARPPRHTEGAVLVPGLSPGRRGFLTLLDAIAVGARRWLGTDPTLELENTILTLNLVGLEVDRHVVVPRPGCPVCGPRQRLREERLAESTFTGPDLRCATPDELWRSLTHHRSPLTGLVGSPKPHRSDFGGEVNIHVAAVRDARDRTDDQRGLDSRCAGTGRTVDAARLGAVCEALERASGLDHGCEPRRRASSAGLGAEAIRPESILLFSEYQYEARGTLNLSQADSNFIPVPFDPNRTTDWSRLRSWISGEDRWLPTVLCYYDGPRDPGHDFGRADSNGCAAGSSLGEAVLHGFFELVERDAAAIWWYNRIPRPGVRLDDTEDSELRPVPELCRRLGLGCWALDLTTDLGVPVFAALCGPPDHSLEGGALGFGAHLDRRVALRRALSEMSLLLANRTPDRPSNVLFSCKPEGAYLVPDPAGRAVHLADLPSPSVTSIQAALDDCVQRVAALGLDFLVLDQTRPGFGLHVARVVVPGLRPFWARFAPGRLYDVPVELGWLDRPRAEDEMNPSHLKV
jgi:ribosomal protein S12 methylthiotransferase accessory factor